MPPGRAPLAALALLLAPLAAAAGFEDGLGPGWTILREDPGSWSLDVYPGNLTIFPQAGALEGPANDAANVFLQQAPEGDFRATTLLHFVPVRAGLRAGLVLYAGDDDFFLLGLGNRDGEPVAEAVLERGGETTASRRALDWTPVWLRLERRGDVVAAYASHDGILWTPAGNGTAPEGADLRVGLLAVKGHDPDAQRAVVDAAFARFEVEAPPQGETHVLPPVVTLVASPESGAPPLETVLTATTSWDYPGLRWTLRFGDGAPPVNGTGFPVVVPHTYAERAVVHPRLDAFNDLGRIGSASATVTVGGSTIFARDPDEGGARGDGGGAADAAATGGDAVPGATTGGGAAPTALLRVRAPGSTEALTVVRGPAVVDLRGARDPAAVELWAVRSDGTSTPLGQGTQASWNTTTLPNGAYTVEARERRAGGGSVTIAAVRVLVENPRADPLFAAAAVATGAAAAAGASATRGFNFLDFAGEAASNSAEDRLRGRTAEVALRRRRVSAVAAAAVTIAVNALVFAWANVPVGDLALLAVALPVAAGAALAFHLLKHGGDWALARRTGARTTFRVWLPGVLALLVSGLVFRAPFGYAGYLRKLEPAHSDSAARRRVAALRALTLLGLILALTLPIVAVGWAWRWEFAEVGVGLVVAVVGSAALPLAPLPGAAVWRWSKAAAVLAAAGGVAVYWSWQVALLSTPALVLLGAVGLVGYAAAWAFLRYPKDGSEVQVEDEG